MVVSGIGGLGHIAVQYARATGMRVAAVDVSDDKLKLALEHGAELVINADDEDPSEAVRREIGGAHAVLVTAVHPAAFARAIAMARRGGTIVFNGLPAGDFPAPIVDIVVRGSPSAVRSSVLGRTWRSRWTSSAGARSTRR